MTSASSTSNVRKKKHGHDENRNQRFFFVMYRVHCSSITRICKWHLANLRYNISLPTRHTNGLDRLFGYVSSSLDLHYTSAIRDYGHLLALPVLNPWLWVKFVFAAQIWLLLWLLLTVTWPYIHKVFSKLQQGATWYRKCFICLIPFLIFGIFSVYVEDLIWRF